MNEKTEATRADSFIGNSQAGSVTNGGTRHLSCSDFCNKHIKPEKQAGELKASTEKLGAYIVVSESNNTNRNLASSEPAVSQAEALKNIVVPIKDNIDVAGMPTRAGSAATSPEPAGRDAVVVSRLRAAGADISIKTALDEFACTTYGQGMRNPHDATRSVGGSSGGSALAVASGVFCAAIGSDTGGSVRIPASYCGVVGFKPTFNAISTVGVTPLSASIDHVGIIGCCLKTVRQVFHVCREPAKQLEPEEQKPRFSSLSELRVGVMEPSYLSAALPIVRDTVERVAALLSESSAKLQTAILPETQNVLERLEKEMREIITEESAAVGVKAKVKKENDSPPVEFDLECVEAVELTAKALGFSHKRMVSGAGHDACYVASHAPTAMIFVPCENGLSHNEAENITIEQAEHGASVLLGAVRRTAE